MGGATLPLEVKEYAADATTLYRRTYTNYNTSTTYSSRHILGLPSERLIYNGSATLVAQTAYTYDESGYFDTTGFTATNQDSTNYGASLVAGRANLTTTTRYETPGTAAILG